MMPTFMFFFKVSSEKINLFYEKCFYFCAFFALSIQK
jgi:hypothetical protein